MQNFVTCLNSEILSLFANLYLCENAISQNNDFLLELYNAARRPLTVVGLVFGFDAPDLGKNIGLVFSY